MPELLDFLWDHWLIAVLFLLAFYGLGALAGDVPAALRQWRRGEPYKPKPYRITVEADDGWPMRSYTLPREAAARLVNQLDRDRDNDKDKPA